MQVPRRYTTTAILLHWLIAAAMILNVVLAWSVDYVGDARVRPIIDLHKSIGITVLGLVILRLLWRYAHRPPPLPSSYGAWEQRAARAGHAALYVLMFALPLSGWLHDSAWKDAATHPLELFHLIPWPRIGWVLDTEPVLREQLHTAFGETHEILAKILYLLFAIHVGAALKHQFIDGKPELQRMLPGASDQP